MILISTHRLRILRLKSGDLCLKGDEWVLFINKQIYRLFHTLRRAAKASEAASHYALH